MSSINSRNGYQPGKARVHSYCHQVTCTSQKMKFYIKGFSSTCDQIRSLLRICSLLLKISLMENFIFVQCDWRSFFKYFYQKP